jgi:hypothetical protein
MMVLLGKYAEQVQLTCQENTSPQRAQRKIKKEMPNRKAGKIQDYN